MYFIKLKLFPMESKTKLSALFVLKGLLPTRRIGEKTR